jgi:hypothetical protein
MPDDINETPIARQIEDVAAATAASPPDDDAKRERDILFRQKKRNDRVQEVSHWILVVAVILIGGVMVIALAIRIVYMILPLKWQWLSPEQIQQLDHFLFSGFVGGVLTQAGRKIAGDFNPPKESDSDSEE